MQKGQITQLVPYIWVYKSKPAEERSHLSHWGSALGQNLGPIHARSLFSPSDLDADDEDNQDYDSASMVSASEVLQARVRALQDSTIDDDAVFNAQFQEIRMAGMQQLADIDAGPSPVGLGDGLLESAASSVEEHVGKV